MIANHCAWAQQEGWQLATTATEQRATTLKHRQQCTIYDTQLLLRAHLLAVAAEPSVETARGVKVQAAYYYPVLTQASPCVLRQVDPRLCHVVCIGGCNCTQTFKSGREGMILKKRHAVN